MNPTEKELSKEECFEALETLCTFADGNPSSSGEFVGKMLQEADDKLKQLINEHFDNTPDFKGFKLHSKSYLKTFKKDELIDYIYMVYRNWQDTDSACNHGMKYAEKLQKINDELQRVVDELNSKETRSNPPLELEDLNPGMWVWDNKWKTYYTIKRIRNKNIYARYVRFVVDPYTDESEVDCGWMGVFVENRFYRYEVKE